jgi:hypothetical protein
MSDLVQRLANGRHRLVFGRSGPAGAALELKAAIERKYVQLKFTETRGGTELGFTLDERATSMAGADFDRAQGRIHLEGELRLDYVPVRLIADVDLATLEGEGQLQILERSAPSA